MKNLLLATFILSATCGHSQPAPKSPCETNPVYRQFDFWVGSWEAYGPKGKKGGDSRIEKLLGGCVVLENWTSAQAGYAGKSYNTFNAATGKWEQYWVDNMGGVTHYNNGHFENNEMVFLTENQPQPKGGMKIQRLTFTKLSDDKVRQHGESSLDSGKSWKTDYDLEYRRTAGSAN
jgi:hypothetical protein